MRRAPAREDVSASRTPADAVEWTGAPQAAAATGEAATQAVDVEIGRGKSDRRCMTGRDYEAEVQNTVAPHAAQDDDGRALHSGDEVAIAAQPYARDRSRASASGSWLPGLPQRQGNA